jgi:dolichyl-phosphate-mannose--protein O-mannosyl transferase
MQNFFSLVTVAGYIFLFWGALKFYPLFYAVLLILFMTPYFWLTVKSLPILKRFYIEKYASEFVDAHDVPNGALVADKM